MSPSIPVQKSTVGERLDAIHDASMQLAKVIETDLGIVVSAPALVGFIIDHWQQLAFLVHTIKRNAAGAALVERTEAELVSGN